MKKITKILTVFGLSFLLSVGVCFGGNPFTDLLGITLPPNINPKPNTDAEKSPFLQEFLIVYQGDWVFVPNVPGPYYSIDISKEPSSCNTDETECCGVLELRELDENSTAPPIECLFCLNSTYEIHIKDLDKTWDIQCIGVRGSKMENPLHSELGYAIDNPTTIECQFFQLVRPE